MNDRLSAGAIAISALNSNNALARPGGDDAIAHINTHGTRHSEAILTADGDHAARFMRDADAAVVYHNASTRFTDGFEFGFGAGYRQVR